MNQMRKDKIAKFVEYVLNGKTEAAKRSLQGILKNYVDEITDIKNQHAKTLVAAEIIIKE